MSYATCLVRSIFARRSSMPLSSYEVKHLLDFLVSLGHLIDQSQPRAEAAEVLNPGQLRAAVPQAGRQVQTLSSSLQLLSNVNPDCLFIVRRINKLGFKAARTLKKHFSTHGNVLRVLVAHSTVRQHGDPQCQARRRPSSLGFVQMVYNICMYMYMYMYILMLTYAYIHIYIYIYTYT